MKIHYHSRVYNEERILPYVFRHYDQFVDHYWIYNQASTDKTKELCLANPKVTVVDLHPGFFDDEENRTTKNFHWKQFSNASNCDWVIICDFDEFLYHPNLPEVLEKYKKEGITFPHIEGYQMFSEVPPTTKGQIYEEIKKGKRANNYDKHIIMHPSIAPNYSYGSHFASPEGPVKYSETSELKLLHYKIFGSQWINDMMERNKRLSPRNQSLGLGVYSLDPNYRFNPQKEYESLKQTAVEIL